DHVGTPLREGLVLAHNCLVGAGLRQSIRLGRERAGGDRFRYRALVGARSRLVQCSPRLYVCVGLHPGAILSYRPLPNRRLDAESLAPKGPRGRRQGRSRPPISPKHARRLGRAGGCGWIGPPEPSSAHAHPQTSLAERGQELRGGLYRVPEIVTLGRLPGEGESDSRWRTKEVRHVGSDTLTPGF